MSGDIHGEELMGSLLESAPASITFAGLGGPKMAARGGAEVEDWVADAAVVGLWEVLKHYRFFKNKLDETLARMIKDKPHLVVLIDYPGFNLRLAYALRERGFEGKIAYYISPQVWAWNRKRIPKMAAALDLMICIFPFEKELYEKSGLKTIYAGHPLVDELKRDPNIDREECLLGLFPGSREREVDRLFPLMLDTAAQLRENVPNLHVRVAAANEALADHMRREAGTRDLKVKIDVGAAHDLMQRATAGMVASGTATLEAAWFGLPYCLVYRVAWPTYLVGRAVVAVPFLGIVNILGEREIVREFIQANAKPENMALEMERLLKSPEDRKALQRDLAEIVAQLGEPGVHERAAQALLTCLTA